MSEKNYDDTAIERQMHQDYIDSDLTEDKCLLLDVQEFDEFLESFLSDSKRFKGMIIHSKQIGKLLSLYEELE